MVFVMAFMMPFRGSVRSTVLRTGRGIGAATGLGAAALTAGGAAGFTCDRGQAACLA